MVQDEKHQQVENGGVTDAASANISSTSSDTHIDPVAERKLVRKLDLIIIPTFFIVYMMSFLDRINISNARIQDMPKDLDLSGKRFNIALLVRTSHHHRATEDERIADERTADQRTAD
jgi:hypothetical protein